MNNRQRKKWLSKITPETLPRILGLNDFHELFYMALYKEDESLLCALIASYRSYFELPGLYLDSCILGHFPEFLRIYYEAGFHPDQEGPILTIAYKNLDTLKLCIEYGADIHSVNCEGEVALGFAAGHGFLDSVKYLLEKGADINFVEGTPPGPHFTPIDSTYYNQEMYDYLRSKGAKHYHELQKAYFESGEPIFKHPRSNADNG